jgi:hypothetical protein
VGGYWKWNESEMWIMVEPIAEILFGIHWSPMWCYRCNKKQELIKNKPTTVRLSDVENHPVFQPLR